MEEGKPIEGMVCSRDAAVGAAICALLGGVLSWLIFAAPGGLKISEDAGSAADWMAAAGTWVIGILAWQIQRDAQAHQKLQAANEEERLRSKRISILSGMIVRTKSAEVEIDAFRARIQEEAEKPQSFNTAKLVFALSVLTLTQRKWTEEERMLLPIDAVYIAEKIERLTFRLQRKAEIIDTLFPDQSEKFERALEGVLAVLFPSFEKDLAAIAKEASDLRYQIISKIEQEGGETSRHRAPAIDDW